MSAYRESAEEAETMARPYITPDAGQSLVVFLDHLMYVRVTKKIISYFMTDGTSLVFEYQNEKRPLEEMKKVAEAKVGRAQSSSCRKVHARWNLNPFQIKLVNCATERQAQFTILSRNR